MGDSPSSHGSTPSLYHLKNSNFILGGCLDQQLREENFVDVSLVCLNRCNEGDSESSCIKAHKMILASSSQFFQTILKQNPCQHPVVILPEGISMEILESILEFVYKGEVSIPDSRLQSVLQAASYLQIQGLSGQPPTHPDEDGIPEGADPSKVWEQSAEGSTSPSERPESQTSSHSLKRKSSPKYHFKNKRKPQNPKKFGDEATGLSLELAESNHFEYEMKLEVPDMEDEVVEEENKPMDFTMKAGNDIKVEEEEEEEEPQGLDVTEVVSPYFGIEASHASSLRPTLVEQVSVHDYDQTPSPPDTKSYTKKDVYEALQALKTRQMSLSRASEVYGIPATTLWQRANRMGIATPKREATNKVWSNEDLDSALDALRKKEISANKASKLYGIPSSTLYKIARKEGIELAQPFNAVQTSWSQEDLSKALDAIRKGMAVQKAASEFGIPSGTLYGRCKKVGIELSKAATVHWSETDMVKALESVQSGNMSINQAAIHHNLPYSSLYGRINRLRKENPTQWSGFASDLSLEAFLATGGTSPAPEASLLALTQSSDHSRQSDYTSAFTHYLPGSMPTRFRSEATADSS
eukprot:maker-scaffold1668_size31705-snap-gene-0.7 protein:Tk00858 transcript:maker-scaffold1668_size31705-snap-gene-0.7-mRNA-1 annotation:"pipsqueak"